MCIGRWCIGGVTFGASENASTPTTVNVAMTNTAAAGEKLDRTICLLFIDRQCNAGLVRHYGTMTTTTPKIPLPTIPMVGIVPYRTVRRQTPLRQYIVGYHNIVSYRTSSIFAPPPVRDPFTIDNGYPVAMMIPSLLISRQRFLRFSRSITTKTTTTTTTTSSEDYPPCAVQVPPPPSWSVRDLRLSPSDNDNDDGGGGKISEEELATLARRCLIDVRRLSSERRDNLRIHVAGIMRCASVLLESKELLRRSGEDAVDGIMIYACDGREKMNQLTDEEVYDAPRGLTKMPIRGGGRRSTKGVGDDTDEDEDDLEQWTLYDSIESKAIMQNDSVRSKMVKTADGETFFSVITKRS